MSLCESSSMSEYIKYPKRVLNSFNLEPFSAADVLRIMNERKITQMFVLDGGKPVGLIHMHDLLKAGLA